jgi:hypothetical protein
MHQTTRQDMRPDLEFPALQPAIWCTLLRRLREHSVVAFCARTTRCARSADMALPAGDYSRIASCVGGRDFSLRRRWRATLRGVPAPPAWAVVCLAPKSRGAGSVVPTHTSASAKQIGQSRSGGGLRPLITA